jgi:hypothetical protein
MALNIESRAVDARSVKLRQVIAEIVVLICRSDGADRCDQGSFAHVGILAANRLLQNQQLDTTPMADRNLTKDRSV